MLISPYSCSVPTFISFICTLSLFLFGTCIKRKKRKHFFPPVQLEIQDINCCLTQEVELAYSHLSKVCWTTLNTSQPICAHFPCLWNWDDIILADVQKLSSSVLGWQHYRSGTQKNTHMPWLIPCRRNQRVEINLLSIQAPAFEAAVWMSYCFFIWQKLSSLPIPEKVENLNANMTCSQRSAIIWRCSVKCIIRKRFLPPKQLRLNKNVLDKIDTYIYAVLYFMWHNILYWENQQ